MGGGTSGGRCAAGRHRLRRVATHFVVVPILTISDGVRRATAAPSTICGSARAHCAGPLHCSTASAQH
eukprot:3805654-Prymnesium_polylepis.1